MSIMLLSLLLLGALAGCAAQQMISCRAQVSSCSCETDQGVIDLSPLSNNDGKAKFPHIQQVYGPSVFSYNPCVDFTESACRNVAVCQIQDTMPPAYYSLGDQYSARFITSQERGLQIQYLSITDVLRTSYVQLICDESEEAKLEAGGELFPGSAEYYLTLTSKYCCPSTRRSTSPPPTLPQMIRCKKQTSSCSCITNRGHIDLSPLAKKGGQARFADVQDTQGNDAFSYNPCEDFSEGGDACKDVAVCQVQGTLPPTYFNLGNQNSAKFTTDQDRGLVIQYSADTVENTLRAAYVQLVCDETEEGKLEAEGELDPASGEYYMILRSKYCCPSKHRTTALSPPTPTSHQASKHTSHQASKHTSHQASKHTSHQASLPASFPTHSSSGCVYESDRGEIDLTPLARRDGEPRFFDVVDQWHSHFLVSYNPCYGFSEGQSRSTCHDVAVCQRDTVASPNMYYDLGTQSSVMLVSDKERGLELRYQSLHNVDNRTRTSYVQLVCNQNEDGKLENLGETPSQSRNYYLRLTSKHCCPIVATTSSPTTPAPPAPDDNLRVQMNLIIALLTVIMLLLVFLLVFNLRHKIRGAQAANSQLKYKHLA